MMQVEEALRRAVKSGRLSQEALDKFLRDTGMKEVRLKLAKQYSFILCMGIETFYKKDILFAS